jgi:hypothetical protein
MEGMEKEVCFPSACVECGKVFDLSYNSEEEIESENTIEISREFLKEMVFCWTCRPVMNKF